MIKYISILLLIYTAGGSPALAAELPTTPATNTVARTVPWLMATMDPATKEMILTEPPEWMLTGPVTNFVAPSTTTIQIECMDSLTNVVVSGEFKTSRPVAFVKWKVIEE